MPDKENKSTTKKYLTYAKNFLYFIALSSIAKDFEEWERLLEQASNYLKSFGLLHSIFTGFDWLLSTYSKWVGMIFWFVPQGIGMFISVLIIITAPLLKLAYLILKKERREELPKNLRSDKVIFVIYRYFLMIGFISILLLIHTQYFDSSNEIAFQYYYVIQYFFYHFITIVFSIVIIFQARNRNYGRYYGTTIYSVIILDLILFTWFLINLINKLNSDDHNSISPLWLTLLLVVSALFSVGVYSLLIRPNLEYNKST